MIKFIILSIAIGSPIASVLSTPSPPPFPSLWPYKKGNEFICEYGYVRALQWDYGWTDAASHLIEKLRKDFPDACYTARLEDADFENQVLEGKFDEFLADTARVETEKDLTRKILAVKIAQKILLAMDMEDGPERNTLLDDLEKANDGQFEVVDSLFGQAVAVNAFIMSLRSDETDVQNVVEQHMPKLLEYATLQAKEDKETGGYKKKKKNPMPRFRYMFAVLLWKKVQIIATRTPPPADLKKMDPVNIQILNLLLGPRERTGQPRKGNGAYNHFVNVFINYPESPWSMEAFLEARKIDDFVYERYKQRLEY
jgi:hypothetical protein